VSWPTNRNAATIRLAIAATVALLIGAPLTERSVAQTVPIGVVATHPNANDIIDGSMVVVYLSFEMPVDHERSTLTLKTVDGGRQLKPRLDSAPNYLVGTAGRLMPGTYELEWVAQLSDGRSANGTIPFTVKPTR
jgi:methionine-rich copper-binding protein CopC